MSRRAHRTNVVDSPASLIGRQGDRAALAACLDAGTRLVTIVGSGGIGKTRVAVRLAVERLADYAAHGGGGVWICDLTEARSGMAVCATVGGVLGVALDRSLGEAQVAARLGAAIARRERILLVLDNFEHLVGAAAITVGAWLAMAPRAQFLITSRVALGLPGEQLWPLAALAVPTPELSPVELGGVEAVALFLARAHQVRPDLDLAGDLPTIAELVRRLDGVPLAIELAAARVRALAPSQILARLDRPLELLVRHGDGGRHGSILRTIVDSVDLLDPATRACFAGCAIFRGGFTLDAAEAVLGEAGRAVLPAIEALCEHSLLRAETRGAGGRRFHVLDTIREVADLELRADPATWAALAARHASYFARHGRELSERAIAHGEPGALAMLADELENLVEAHTRSVAALATTWADATAGHVLEVALALDPLLAARGLLRLRLRLLDAAVDIATRAGGTSQAAVLIARAQARRELGELTAARADLAAARVVVGSHRAARLEATIDVRLGELVEIAGDTAAARASFQRALATLEGTAADPVTTIVRAEAHARLGHALRREGELAGAGTEVDRAAALYQHGGHHEGVAAMAYETGVIALFQREYAAAHRAFDQAASIADTLGARQLGAAVASGLGILTQAEGALTESIGHHAAAVQAFRDLGNRHREGSALYYLACAYLERGEPAQAMVVLDQAEAAVIAVGAVRYQALVAGARAAAHAALGDPDGVEAALVTARHAAAACQSEPALTATLAIHALHRGWQATTDRDPVVGEARRIADATLGDDPQLALRLVLARAGSRAQPAAGLAVSPDGAWFHAPGAGAPVDLTRRVPLRRILAALVARRLDAPGEALAQHELVAAGWPGEFITHEAASNRLHVALTTLRKLGLRGLLVSGEHGYLLSPTIAVERGAVPT